MHDMLQKPTIEWVAISPPLGGARGYMKPRSMVPGVPPRRFPSVVVPKVITTELIIEWLNLDDLTALDFSVLTALASGTHGARNCTFRSHSARETLGALLNDVYTRSGSLTPSEFRDTATYFSSLRRYVEAAGEVVGWESPTVIGVATREGIRLPGYTPLAKAARTAMITERMSLEDFRAAMGDVRDTLNVVKESGLPTELADALLSSDWQKACLKRLIGHRS